MEDKKYVSIPYSNLKIGQEIGKGAFGKVSKGKYKFADVAIKELILDKLSKDSLEELQQEASIMSKILHPHVVQFFGACMEQGHYAIVMEYVAKGSLYNLLQSDTEMNWPMRITISMDMGAGLAYLHSQSILHRDLKSLNVLITDSNRAKLTDFGLSKIKHETSSTTKNTAFVGSLLWMAPELLSDENPHYNQKTDVFSYGVTLWEIASRSLPFKKAQNAHLASMWVMQGKRETIPSDTPQSYASLISKCWAQRQDDRPIAEQAVELLEKLSESDEILPVPKTTISTQTVKKNTEEQKKEQEIPFNYLSNSLYSPASLIKLLPASQSPVIQTSPQTSHEQVSEKAKAISNQVNVRDVAALLKWVAEGHLEETEKLLQKNPQLALAQGTVKDLSSRTFENITAFQLAIWYLDIEMWEILLKYMEKPLAALQLEALENDRKDIHQKYGKYFNFNPLIKAYQIYDDNFENWNWTQRDEHWCKKVGGEQRMFPAWVIYAFCEEGNDKAWPRQDFTKKVKREYGASHVLNWFTTIHPEGVYKICDKWALARGRWARVALAPSAREGRPGCHVGADRKGAGMSVDQSNSQLLRSRQEEQLGKLQASLQGFLNAGKPSEGLRK